MRILLVEDDAELALDLCDSLAGDGYDVDHAADGASGLRHILDRSYDVAIVDRMLPGLSGLSGLSGLGLVRRTREAGVRTPVLFLTTLDGVYDRVEGLDAGGDDYLTKPFATAELLARLRALGRRGVGEGGTVRRRLSTWNSTASSTCSRANSTCSIICSAMLERS